MKNILRIDVGATGGPSATVTPVGRYATLGGRAMTSTIVWEEVPPTCDPLGPESKLVISPGIMSGSPATTSGRLSVGCKSPLTGGIKEANAGGQASQYLARLGYAAVVLEGARKSDDLYKIFIDKEGVRITMCNEYRMLCNYDLADRIKADHGKKVGMISIGPAGELRMANSTIAVTDTEFRPTRHAARGGVGAVMGSKGIKLIVVDPQGTKQREAADPERFKKANKKLAETLKSAEHTGEVLPIFGTASLGDIINEMGCYPALNFSKGRYEDYEDISAETLTTMEKDRGGKGAPTHGCHTGCQIRCSGLFYDKNGQYVTKQPEYETIWAVGANCGIHDLDAIARIDRLCDDLGIDTMETGCTIAMLMEAGVLKQGDAEAALALIAEMGHDTEKGRMLGAGTESVGKAHGVKRIPVVKGQAMAAYDPRALKGLGVTYATSPMGADHTAGHTLANHLGHSEPVVDALAGEGQWMASAIAQISSAAFDSTGYCLFLGFAAMDRPDTVKHLLDSMSAFTGDNYNEQSFAALGIRILRMERDFNTQAGMTPEDDRIPEWMTKEPLAPHNTVFDVSVEEMELVHDHVNLLLTMIKGVNMAFSPPIANFGIGAHRMVPDNLAALGVTKALIVTDKGVVEAGLLKMLEEAMDVKFMEHAVYDGTEPNPTVSNLSAALEVYRREGCDGIVSLGGGSSHDCAKGVGIMANNPGSINDYIGLFTIRNSLPPLIAVTTTSGTGSEVSYAVVIVDPDRHVKMVIADPKILPIIAVNDPMLCRTMPPHITAGTGMDALTHAVEAYISTLANPFSDGLALQGIALIAENLPKVFENGDDMDARTNMCYGQYFAALAFNGANLGNTHSVAHALGASYGLPHGDLNAIVLPHVLRKNKDKCVIKLARIAETMGVDTTGVSTEEAADRAIQAIELMSQRTGISATLTELLDRYKKTGDRGDIPAIVDHAIQDPCGATNPVVFTRKDFIEICEAAW